MNVKQLKKFNEELLNINVKELVDTDLLNELAEIKLTIDDLFSLLKQKRRPFAIKYKPIIKLR